MADKTQHKIGRVRPPRVQITYDVEIGDAVETKELPFVVAVLADFAGHAQGKKLKERKFTQVDNESLDDVMASMAPELSFTVPNQMDDTSAQIPVDLKFNSMKDFSPMSLVNHVDKLREAYEKRQALNALLAKLFVDDDLATSINDVIKSTASDEELKGKLAELVNKL